MDSFHVRDNWGEQLDVHDNAGGTVAVRYLGPRGALKGFMELSAEQATALAEFLAPHLSAGFLALHSTTEGRRASK